MLPPTSRPRRRKAASASMSGSAIPGQCCFRIPRTSRRYAPRSSYMAKLKPEFDRRNVKIIGLSVDPLDRHSAWAKDIEETQGFAPNYPMIADPDLSISKAWGMLPASANGDASKRTAADNQTVRNVFVVGPDKKIKLVLVYPMTTGRNFDEVLRVIDSLQLTAKHKVATPVNWKQGEDVIIAGSVSDDDAPVASGSSPVWRDRVAKLVERFAELVPGMKRVGVVRNPNNPAVTMALRETEDAGPPLLQCT